MNKKEIQLMYEKYGFMIYGRCLKILSSSEDARDAMQVVFMKLFKKYDTIHDKSLIVPWIFRVAQNHCFNVLRKGKKFRDSVKADEVVHIDDFDDQLGKRQILTLIMGRVNRKIRDAVHYTFIEELNQREITLYIAMRAERNVNQM
jgi:RNA polymerase sigma-70 factor (ECF subfamily)